MTSITHAGADGAADTTHAGAEGSLRRDAAVPAGRTYTHREILTVITVLLFAILLAALDQTIVSTAIPTIAGELNGLDRISWLVTAYLLAQTIAMPICGKLGDLYGRKWLLIYAVICFLVGSALSGLAQSMNELIAFRALQGLGAGGVLVTAFSIIGDVIPPRDRGKYLAYIMPVFGLASVFGPTLGGFFIDNLSWRWIFYVNLPIGLVAIAGAWWKLDLPKGAPGNHRIDYGGAALLAAAMSCAVLATTWGGDLYGWLSPEILGLAAASVVFAALFYLAERHAHDPIFAPDFFHNGIILDCMALGITVGLGLFGTLTYLPTFLQIARQASPTASGLLMLPLSVGLFVAAVTTGQLISRTGRYKLFPIGGTIAGSVGMYLLSTIGPDTPSPLLDGYMVILGAGLGMVMPVLTQVAQNAVRRERLGMATSGVNLARQLSGAVGVAIAGTLFTSRLHTHLVETVPANALARMHMQGARIDPAAMADLPPKVHTAVIDAFGAVLPSVFLDFVPVMALGILFALLLREVPLATARTPEKGRRIRA